MIIPQVSHSIVQECIHKRHLEELPLPKTGQPLVTTFEINDGEEDGSWQKVEEA